MRLSFRRVCDAFVPEDQETMDWFLNLGSSEIIELEFKKKRRTNQQNRALHKFFRLMSDALNDAGFDLRAFPWREGAEVPWDADLVKYRLWHPLQKVMIGEESTAELKTDQIDKVYKVLNKKISESTGVNVEFPRREQL